jgi:hypothetical protein
LDTSYRRGNGGNYPLLSLRKKIKVNNYIFFQIVFICKVLATLITWCSDAKCDFKTHSVIFTRDLNAHKNDIYMQFPPAECNFLTQCDLDRHECDYNMHKSDFNKHKSDFYMQNVILTHFSVIMTITNVITKRTTMTYTSTSWISTRFVWF